MPFFCVHVISGSGAVLERGNIEGQVEDAIRYGQQQVRILHRRGAQRYRVEPIRSPFHSSDTLAGKW